jgi:DNA-binding FadR family transcriptional regulator
MFRPGFDNSRRRNIVAAKIGPAVRLVINSIMDGIAQGSYLEGTPLPTRQELARMLGVSTNTVRLAMAALKQDGTLRGVRGQKAQVAPRSPANHGNRDEKACSGPGRPWELVAGQIRHDIMIGAFKTKTVLPDIKELQSRYQSSYLTVRKALDHIIGQNLLLKRGRRLALPPASTTPHSSRILFLWYSEKPFLPSHDNDTSFIRTLERECIRCAVEMDKLIISTRKNEIVLWHHEDRAPVDSRILHKYAGVVYLVNWWASVNPIVFGWLTHLGKPVSIVDWLGGWEPPQPLSRRDSVQWMQSTITKSPGFGAGRYLIGLGHQRIAYFSPFSLAWPAVRRQGLIDICRSAGKSFGVASFIQQEVKNQQDFLGLTMKMFGLSSPAIEGPSKIPSEYSAARIRLSSTTWIAYENSAYYAVLKPLFEKALLDGNSTAWVGCNDEVALMAWSFLRSKGIRIPQDISILGFGNTLEAVVADVTSYDFDFEAIASAMLHFLLRPGIVGKIPRLIRPEIEGHIVARGSTAKRMG